MYQYLIINKGMECPKCEREIVYGGIRYHVFLSIITLGFWAGLLAEFWFLRWVLQLLHIVKPWDGCYEYMCLFCGHQWRGKPESTLPK